MFRSGKAFVIFGAVSVTVLAAAIARMGSHDDPAEERRAVFVQTWKILGSKYYDHDMNGFDWRAVRMTYERQLGKPKNSFELYWNVLRPMARLLESSHVQLKMPRRQPRDSGEPRPEAAAPARNVEACAGLWLAEGRRHLSTRVIYIDSRSQLYKSGVRKDWRLLSLTEGRDQSRATFVAKFITTAGEDAEVLIGPLSGDHGPDAALVRKDIETLKQLLRDGADPMTELQLDALGARFLLGRLGSMPVVAEVIKGSKAELAGIEPESTLSEWNTKQATGGELQFIAKLVSPTGSTYAANFEFKSCDTERLGADLTAERLPSNVLHLRFDIFRPEVIVWLDEQLRTKPDAIILDLRHNGGGDAAVLLEVLGRFLDPSARVAQVISQDRVETWTASEAPVVFRGPLAVLVGPLSASAAEVSASALLFHRRATVHGQNTPGSVQLSQEYPLDDGGMVQVAIADVRSPDGHRLENVGVRVSHAATPTLASIRAGRDVALESAVAELVPKAVASDPLLAVAAPTSSYLIQLRVAQ